MFAETVLQSKAVCRTEVRTETTTDQTLFVRFALKIIRAEKWRIARRRRTDHRVSAFAIETGRIDQRIIDGEQIDNDQEGNKRSQRHPSMKQWLLEEKGRL